MQCHPIISQCTHNRTDKITCCHMCVGKHILMTIKLVFHFIRSFFFQRFLCNCAMKIPRTSHQAAHVAFFGAGLKQKKTTTTTTTKNSKKTLAINSRKPKKCVYICIINESQRGDQLVSSQKQPHSLSPSLSLSLFSLFHTSLSLSLSDSLVRLFLRAGSEKKINYVIFVQVFYYSFYSMLLLLLLSLLRTLALRFDIVVVAVLCFLAMA